MRTSFAILTLLVSQLSFGGGGSYFTDNKSLHALCEPDHYLNHCASKIQEHQVRSSKAISHRNGVLRIEINDRKSVDLKDVVDEGDKSKSYYYIEYIPRINQHYVYEQDYEWSNHLLVSNSTGKIVNLNSRPYISPDGQRLFSFEPTSFMETGFGGKMSMHKWTSSGYIKEMDHEFKQYEYEFVRWDGSSRVILRQNEYFPKVCAEGGHHIGVESYVAAMNLNGNRWQFEPNPQFEKLDCDAP